MKIYHTVSIDLARDDACVHVPALSGTEGDCGTHVLQMRLLQNGSDWPVPDDATALISYARLDGTGGTYDTLPDGEPAWSIKDGLVYVELAPACFAVATKPWEEIWLTVTLLRGDSQITTRRIPIVVQRSLVGDGEDTGVYVNFSSVIRQYIGDTAELNTENNGNIVEAVNEVLEKCENSAGGVSTVCGIAPSDDGNVHLVAENVGALSMYGGIVDGQLSMDGNRLTDLCDPEENADAVPKYWVNRRIAGKNLLDNWYFKNPVNQRGASFYGIVGPCIDRWAIASEMEVSITDSGLDICCPVASGRLGQFLENPMSLNGQTVTATVLLTYNDGGFVVALQLIRNEEPISLYQIETDMTGAVSFTYTFGSQQIQEGDRLCLYFGNDDTTGGNYGLAAAKLELGRHQTLARMEDSEWVLNEIPDYTGQLMHCLRFFQIFRTQSLRPAYAEDFRPPMRGDPTLSTFVRDDVTYYTASAEL